MRFVVIQNGARRGYAVPEILERAGMLERFYTDICASVGFGRTSAWLRHLPWVGPPFQRLHGRRLPPSIVNKTRTFAVPMLQDALGSWWLNGNLEAAFRFHIQQKEKMGHSMTRAGFGHATHIYSMLGEGGPFLIEAKRRGLTVVSEVYIMLATESILEEERKAFPNWEPDTPDYGAVRRELSRVDPLLSSSDFFVCPSQAVQNDLVRNSGIESSRTAIVPYGMNPRWLRVESRPLPGRVLFVGTAELRKGVHYLAMAAEQLKLRGYHYEFRIAGNVSSHVAERPECRHLTFLGRVPRERIHQEFEQADIFVLPSLAEGSAEATYEAMASGVPVVTTASTGSVVRHGLDGLVVPERDATTLADAIVQIIEDRALRERMSVATRERAKDYTWDRYGVRLIAALQQFENR